MFTVKLALQISGVFRNVKMGAVCL